MNTLYKIRHIPSGLFICPSKNSDVYSSLSEKGKVYKTPAAWKRFLNKNLVCDISIDPEHKLYKKYAKLFPENVTPRYKWDFSVKLKNEDEAIRLLIDKKDKNGYLNYKYNPDNYVTNPRTLVGYELKFDYNLDDFEQVFIEDEIKTED